MNYIIQSTKIKNNYKSKDRENVKTKHIFYSFIFSFFFTVVLTKYKTWHCISSTRILAKYLKTSVASLSIIFASPFIITGKPLNIRKTISTSLNNTQNQVKLSLVIMWSVTPHYSLHVHYAFMYLCTSNIYFHILSPVDIGIRIFVILLHITIRHNIIDA